MRILVIEDDFSISKLLRVAFERDGYDVATAETGGEGLEVLQAWRPDIVVLDLMLPDINGREVARRIRAASDVPIVMVTALGSESDRVQGLDVGADDYIVKPFSLAELTARVRAVSRRSKGMVRQRTGPLQHADLWIDPDGRRVVQGAEEVSLTKREFEILRMLMQRPGELVTRSDIAHAVWGRTAASAANLLDVHMSSLRKKLGDDSSEPRHIETVRGEGFRLAKVATDESEPRSPLQSFVESRG